MPFSASPGVVPETSQRLAVEPTKTCMICEETKPHSEFNKDNRNKVDGLFNVCKACKREQKNARAEGREPARARRAGRGGAGRSRRADPPMVALAKAIEEYAKQELEAQRFASRVTGARAKNQSRCQAYVDWLIRNDGRPVCWGEVKVNPMVFAVAREGGSLWGWPEVTEEDREMAESNGQLPCLYRMSLTDALEYPEWLHLYDGWNPTNFLNFSAWAGLKAGVHFATLGALSSVWSSIDLSELDVDAEWDAMLDAD